MDTISASKLSEINSYTADAIYSVKTQLKRILRKKKIKYREVKEVLNKKNASTISKILDEKIDIPLAITDILKLCLYYNIDFYSLFPEDLNNKFNEIRQTHTPGKSFPEIEFIETSVVKKLYNILNSVSKNHILLIDTFPENGQTFALEQYIKSHPSIIYLQNKSLDGLQKASEPLIAQERKDDKIIIVIESTEKLKKELIEQFIDYTTQHSFSLVFIGKNLKHYFEENNMLQKVDRIEELPSLSFSDKNLFMQSQLQFIKNPQVLRKINSLVEVSGIHDIISIIKQCSSKRL